MSEPDARMATTYVYGESWSFLMISIIFEVRKLRVKIRIPRSQTHWEYEIVNTCARDSK